MRLHVVLVVAALLAARSAAQEDAKEPAWLTPGFAVAAHRVVDFDRDGIDELLIVGRAGEVQVLSWVVDEGGRGSLVPAEAWTLPAPDRCILALAPVLDPDGPLALVLLDATGLRTHRFADGGLAAKGTALGGDARLEIRTGAPLFTDFVRDCNGDGRIDVVVPGHDGVALWLNRPPKEPGGAPTFQRTALVKVRTEIHNQLEGEVLEHELKIPDLGTLEVNGDGRPDLVVVQSNGTEIFLQRQDGSLPQKPDAVLDLGKFRDTTDAATVRPGYTLAGTESARSLIRDIDDDGIPDYLVAHRRKVWIFHGSKDGPQFVRPTQILKTADDLTAIWLSDLDDDRDLDLLILRVQVPTWGALLTGLVGAIKVDFSAFGYENQGGRKLATAPTWKRDLRFVLPSLSEILGNPEQLIRRFEEAGKSFRPSVLADFDFDGTEDVALVAEDQATVEIWFGDPARPAPPEDELEDVLRRVLFEDDQDTWDVDRILAWIEELGSARAERLTAGRKPDRRLHARDPEGFALVAADALRTGKGAVLLRTFAPRDGSALRRFDVRPIRR